MLLVEDNIITCLGIRPELRREKLESNTGVVCIHNNFYSGLVETMYRFGYVSGKA